MNIVNIYFRKARQSTLYSSSDDTTKETTDIPAGYLTGQKEK